ncbi:immunity 49 family protein [Streptomyces sp. NPDC017943]|uniref:immunity 49 family protein n=1 Tax=Streptomyces sp. NPDC017943 TaxID=3365019 RepID=UPI0037B327B0
MTTRVARHGGPGPDDEGYAQDLGEGLAETIALLEQSPRMLDSALSEAMTYLNACLAVDPDAATLRTWEATVTTMHVTCAAFATAGRTEGSVEVRFPHRTLTIPATGPQYYADAGNWLSAFWLAVVCREQSQMTKLCEVPVDLLRASGGEYDEFVFRWIDALQTYWLERPGLGEKLESAVEGSSPEVARIADREVLDKILYQPIGLFHQFLRKDHQGFNRALHEALVLHREFWTADEDRERSVDGYLALGLLAITCLAHDAGFPIDVESPYMPGQLLDRAWLGEFPTS